MFSEHDTFTDFKLHKNAQQLQFELSKTTFTNKQTHHIGVPNKYQ